MRQPQSRERLSDERVAGIVTAWRGGFGWLQLDAVVDHLEAAKHGGRVFVHKSDLEGAQRLSNGQAVDFLLYTDGNGLGAEQCRIAAEGRTPVKGVIRTIAKKGKVADAKPAKGSGFQGVKVWLGARAITSKAVLVNRVMAPRAIAPQGIAAPGCGASSGSAKCSGKGSGPARVKGDKPVAARDAQPAQPPAQPLQRSAPAPKAAPKVAAKVSAQPAPASQGGHAKGGKGKSVSALGAGEGCPAKPAKGAKGGATGEAKASIASGVATGSLGSTGTKPRTRVSSERVSGVVTRWCSHFGWIHPHKPLKHEGAPRHRGDIFVHQTDTEGGWLERGMEVNFFLYHDSSGLGAEQCRPTASWSGQGQGLSTGQARSGQAVVSGKEADQSAARGGAKGSVAGVAPRAGKGYAGGSAKGACQGNKGSAQGNGKGSARSLAQGSAQGSNQGIPKGSPRGSPKGGDAAAGMGPRVGIGKGIGVQKTMAKVMTPKPKSQHVKPAQAAAARLPTFWEEHWSDEHNVPYYWNSKTKESRWTPPGQ